MNYTRQDLDTCLKVLQIIANDPSAIDEHCRLKSLIAKIHRKGKASMRQKRRQQRIDSDRQKIANTQILSKRRGAELTCDDHSKIALERSRTCYICKEPFTDLHFFYHQLCPKCAAVNWSKRQQRSELFGRTALVTGGRTKIGFQTVLKLLRDNARVLVTTRFPRDACNRFAAEADFVEWRDRLRIYGLDLRDIPAVEEFARRLVADEPYLDILIHNAAQTIKRPLKFYEHLLEARDLLDDQRSLMAQCEHDDAVLLETRPGYQGQLPSAEEYFPSASYDLDGQQVDYRPTNSWKLRLGEVSTIESLEVFLVNATAPFVLSSRLRPLLEQSPNARRFIVNVSAMEGQFSRAAKTSFHPHTNMAKAALNMLTRTSSADLAADAIYMNSVDTGWITDERPHPEAMHLREDQGFYPPLDIVDGASRIFDPIATGINEDSQPLFGHFLKDYAPYPW